MSTQFNPTYYLQNNPDVVVAIAQGILKDAADHYNRFGAKELRNPNAIFDAKYYASRNPDVLNAVAAGVFPSVYAHYLAFGATEGRVPNAAFANFDADRYLNDNADVKAAGLTTPAAALKHFVEYGVDEGRAAFDKGGSPITINSSGNNAGFTLTNGTDIATANVFTSGLVYTPGGNDRINALQDEDVLTGTGTNPTLNATIGNPHDNGATTITPKLNGIETLNLAFTGSDKGANTVDLQDATGVKAVNVTRVTEGLPVHIRNLTSVPANLSLSNLNSPAADVGFTFTAAGAKGNADATTVTVTDVNVGNLRIEQNSAAPTEGVETITIASKGGANVIGNLVAEDLAKLVITGSTNLTVGGQDHTGGSFTTVDAGEFTGKLNFRVSQGNLAAVPDGKSNGDVAFTFIAGKGDDTVILQDQVGKTDSFDGREGADTLRFESNSNGAFTVLADNATAQVKGFETVQLFNTKAADKAAAAAVFTYNSDQTDGDQAIELKNANDGAGINTTYNLNNLSANEAKAITITHSGTKTVAASNALADNVVNVALKADSTSDTVQLTLQDGVNSDQRFNVELNAAKVENITLVDGDGESNTVKLTKYADHTGTITLSGKTAGAFLNLDATANFYKYDTSGAEVDGKFVVDGGDKDSKAERLTASVFDATAEAGNVVARFGSSTATNGGQKISLGAGNDTVIFDAVDDYRAGLTISDTVSGGAGDDTLVIDGHLSKAGEIALGASEWTNVSGFETIRLVNPGAGSTYRLTLTNELINANNKNGVLAIQNDNDTANNKADGTNSAGSAAEAPVVIDARSLNNSVKFSYDGEEGTTSTADRIIFSDVNINGNHVIDGGAANIDVTGRKTSVRNADVIEVRNSAVVSVGDLANIKNIGTFEFTNDLAVTQTSTLQLNDEVVDSLVDSLRASTSGFSGTAYNVETLRVSAIDNANVNAATTGLTIEGSALTAKSAVSAVLGRGTNNVSLGTGGDTVVVLGNFTAADAASFKTDLNGISAAKLANGVAGLRTVTDKINLRDTAGAGAVSYQDTLVVVGDADLTAINSGLTVQGVVGGLGANVLRVDAGSDVKLTVDQLNALTKFEATGITARTVEVIGTGTIDLSKIALLDGAGDLNLNFDAAKIATKGAWSDASNVGDVIINGAGALPTASLSVAPASVAEGGVLNYTVTLSAASATDTTVKYTTSGTATSGTDYTAPTGSVVVKAGQLTGTIAIATLNDAVTPEATETVIVTLASSAGYSLGGTNSATGSITDGPIGSSVVVPVAQGGTQSIVGTAAADTFTFDLSAARAASANTVVEITGFEIGKDKLQLNLPALKGNISGATLGELNGDTYPNNDVISVRANAILGGTLITFGGDTDGDLISVKLLGITDITQANAIQVLGA